jgi:hypothetical protein
VTSRYIESQKKSINTSLALIMTSHYNMLDHGKRKKRTIYLTPKAKPHYGPEDLRSTPNEFSHEQIRTHVKYTDKIPRPSHNIYTKIFPLWLSEGSPPGALRCIYQNEIFIKHGRNKILPAKNTSTQHNGRPGKREVASTRVRKWNKKKGRGVT